MKIVTAAAVQKAIGKPLRAEMAVENSGGNVLVISRPTCIGLVGFRIADWATVRGGGWLKGQ